MYRLLVIIVCRHNYFCELKASYIKSKLISIQKKAGVNYVDHNALTLRIIN